MRFCSLLLLEQELPVESSNRFTSRPIGVRVSARSAALNCARRPAARSPQLDAVLSLSIAAVAWYLSSAS